MDRLVAVLLGSLFTGGTALAYPLQAPHTPEAQASAKPTFEARREVEFGGPVLGVMATELTPELQDFYGANGLGVLISRVFDDTAAAEAGIEVGDVLVSVDGEPVGTVMELRQAVDDSAGRDVDVELVRGGRLIVVEARLADMARPLREFDPSWVSPEVLVIPHEEVGRYVDLWVDHDPESYRRAQAEREEEFRRLERHLEDLHERLDIEFEAIQDRLDALEEQDFGRPEVK